MWRLNFLLVIRAVVLQKLGGFVSQGLELRVVAKLFQAQGAYAFLFTWAF